MRRAKPPEGSFADIANEESEYVNRAFRKSLSALDAEYPEGKRSVSISQNQYTALKAVVTNGVALARAVGLRDQTKIDSLEARLKTIEATAKGMKYCGVWKATEAYAKGNFVTADGSLWHANRDVAGVEPGKGDTAWTLAVKRGRDARS
jgi:hypothetical protein